MHHLMEPLSDVDGDIVDAVLHGTVGEVGKKGLHLAAVGVSHLGGLQTQLTAALEVDEAVGPGIVVKFNLVGAVECME